MGPRYSRWPLLSGDRQTAVQDVELEFESECDNVGWLGTLPITEKAGARLLLFETGTLSPIK